MRWVLGSIVDMPARVAPQDVPPETPDDEAPPLRDVEPEAFWDAEARELSVKPRPYDPGAEAAPIQAAVLVLPEGSELIGAEPDAMIASPQPRTIATLSTDPAGGPDVPLPLPGHDDSINNAVVLLYGYRA